jgi:hypothetical protein
LLLLLRHTRKEAISGQLSAKTKATIQWRLLLTQLRQMRLPQQMFPSAIAVNA